MEIDTGHRWYHDRRDEETGKRLIHGAWAAVAKLARWLLASIADAGRGVGLTGDRSTGWRDVPGRRKA